MISCRNWHLVVAAALSAGVLLDSNRSVAGDAVAGARLDAERCARCHSSTDMTNSFLPFLEGQPKAAFLAKWRDFREGKRTYPFMVFLAQELSEREVDDLAEHYAAVLPPRTTDASDSDAARALVDRLRCIDCHGAALQGTEGGAARLAGQKARYTARSLTKMRDGARSHGTAAVPDPLLADLSVAEIKSLAAHLASLR